jgi:hypothetical protein
LYVLEIVTSNFCSVMKRPSCCWYLAGIGTSSFLPNLPDAFFSVPTMTPVESTGRPGPS